MSEAIQRLDVKGVLRGLKDFQRDTVEYVFQRMFVGPDPTRRFLIADEVGLGKTLVAKGVVAKAIDHLWDTVQRIDVVYICSNASIARQNINRLNVTREKDFQIASRITLLPITLHNLKNRKLNFVSFTPGTSFDLKSALGIQKERAVLHGLLDRAWGVKGKGPANVLQGDASADSFRWWVDYVEKECEIDDAIAEEFAKALARQGQPDGSPDLKTRFLALCDQFKRVRKYIPDEEDSARRQLVGELRALLASTCLDALQPDLVILDEFQRFRHLLDGTDEASDLASKFFAYPDARILLLSATPYKMLTLQQERDEGEDHYQDFIRTVGFLQNNPQETETFERLLTDYRREILRLQADDTTQLRSIGGQIATQLRRIMVRTERLAASRDRDGMLQVVPSKELFLDSKEIAGYLQLQGVARALNHSDTIEYWKSAPYLLNFMDCYQLKEAFDDALESGADVSLKEALRAADSLFLSPKDIEAYNKIDPSNGRLRHLIADTVERGVWRLLWLPPVLPYYELGGPFSNPLVKKFTKRLVFSAWRVVPRVIASLLSYEVERKIFTTLESEPVNTIDARKRRRPLLRFARSDDRLTGLPLFCLLYPSLTLAMYYDPLEILLAQKHLKDVPPVESLIAEISADIEKRLSALGSTYMESDTEDETWYWAGPILLDLTYHGKDVAAWFGQEDLATQWAGGDEEEDDEEQRVSTRWDDHVAAARKIKLDRLSALGRPPKDLAVVLAKMALAGPAVVALRSLIRVTRGSAAFLESADKNAMLNGAGQIAWGFLRLFNLPEATGLLRGINRTEPYWQNVLDYCVDGCLQATVDEYVHVLIEGLGIAGHPIEVLIDGLVEAITDSTTLRTATLNVDYVKTQEGEVKSRQDGPRMRSHFALRFGDEKSEQEQGVVRSDQVKTAFNSPFWPFVIATTSVGQEGLDFHTYCHAVVHWNLPSNPVDLEQREGRVHRFKGHAVRKNVSAIHGRVPLAGVVSDAWADPWKQLFGAAIQQRAAGESDLQPFWIFDAPNGAKIERHVPSLPLSRDEHRKEALRKSLAVYRMVFGQIRQDDLIAFLLSQFPEQEMARITQELRIDLTPPKLATSEG